MLKYTFAILGLTLAMLTACGESASTDTPEPDGLVFEVSNTLQADVQGMHCTGCEASMVAALQDVPGVKAVKADHKSGRVTVALADDADMQPDALALAIRQAKPDYKVGEVVKHAPTKSASEQE